MSSLPAARKALIPVMEARGNCDSHPGLVLQRYLKASAAGTDGDPEEKRVLLQATIKTASQAGLQQLYKEAYQRWRDSLAASAQVEELKTLGRLIVGLGSENVIEAGITLHHTYGMPIVPGSGLKGLAAHYCDQVWGAIDPHFKKPTAEEDKAYRQWLEGRGLKPRDNFHRLLFGTTDDSGCIIFHDAWYVPGSDQHPLKLDVMTPHHLEWLDGTVPPTDFDSPTPVPFLSVSGRFLIAVSWHGPAVPAARQWRDVAMTCLREALFQWGVGGKTSSGYGRFDQKAWQEDQKKTTKR
ncbi:MAG: type III-B CRISPR module RAMP protein Cmr6 [Gemmataceae bacterium]|nr:type III-B CRISPR module RAMP protein Cmr6 [Gemmataceae bacterium]MDW8266394.1 type III-B CRISPR module RAMP protein Cmr6 [Gemmataceae bacterium]